MHRESLFVLVLRHGLYLLRQILYCRANGFYTFRESTLGFLSPLFVNKKREKAKNTVKKKINDETKYDNRNKQNRKSKTVRRMTNDNNDDKNDYNKEDNEMTKKDMKN